MCFECAHNLRLTANELSNGISVDRNSISTRKKSFFNVAFSNCQQTEMQSTNTHSKRKYNQQQFKERNVFFIFSQFFRLLFVYDLPMTQTHLLSSHLSLSRSDVEKFHCNCHFGQCFPLFERVCWVGRSCDSSLNTLTTAMRAICRS